MSATNQGQEHRNVRFATTHWTLVLAAAQTESPEARQALEELCQSYWYPLYAFARRKGLSPHDAEDLTQGFFASRVATKLVLHGLDPKLGKFRTWLLNSYQNYLHNERARRDAQKRGGDLVHLSLDLREGEGRYLAEPGCEATPEQFYDRTWGVTMLTRALAVLRSSYEENGEYPVYRELAKFLPGAQTPPGHKDVAATLGLSEAAFKMKVSRLRRELGRLLRAEVKRTVSSASEVEDELRYLRTVLGA